MILQLSLPPLTLQWCWRCGASAVWLAGWLLLLLLLCGCPGGQLLLGAKFHPGFHPLIRSYFDLPRGVVDPVWMGVGPSMVARVIGCLNHTVAHIKPESIIIAHGIHRILAPLVRVKEVLGEYGWGGVRGGGGGGGDGRVLHFVCFALAAQHMVKVEIGQGDRVEFQVERSW